MVETQNSPVYSKRDVDYRKGEEPEVCKNCIYFTEPLGIKMFSNGSCEVVSGRIKSGDTCNLWSPNEDTEEED